MSLNDLHAVAALRRRQARLFDGAPRAAQPKKILLYSVDMWQLGVVEQFMHLAFQLRGHKPVSVFYDGLLPITGWENYWVRPPALEKLRQRAEFVFGAFGIPAIGISSYLEETVARRHAEAYVDAHSQSQWQTLVYRDIEIGRIARRDLTQYSMGCFEPCGAEDFAEYRRHMIHAVMSVDLAHSIIERERPDIVVLVNGKLVMYSYMYEVARTLGMETTTWEEGMYSDTAIRLSHNEKAIDFAFEPEAWEQCRSRPLDRAAARQVEEYFQDWRKQTATSYKYYREEVRDMERIRRELSLPAGDRIVSIFTNILWDSNALEKDDAFDGMMDWVFTSIDVVGRLPGATLVVRAHPGEIKCRFQTRTPVRRMILERYGCIPAFVRIVDGESELSSYEIARHSDRCAVYTSTLGIEFALMGLAPMVCGVPYYSRKGFTHDVSSKEQYTRLLAGEEHPRNTDVEMLKRFMHLIIFKLLKHPEFIVGIHDTPQQPIVKIDTFEAFPESMPEFNRIVDCILERKSFIRLDEDRPAREQDASFWPESASNPRAKIAGRSAH